MIAGYENFKRCDYEAEFERLKELARKPHSGLRRSDPNYTGVSYRVKSNCVICLEDGAIHRADGGPAVMEVSSENRWVVEWIVNGQYHRDDGPCYINEKNGISGWFIDGKHHRDDGPAIVNPNDDGDLYFIHGTKCTKQAQELYYMLKYRKSCNS